MRVPNLTIQQPCVDSVADNKTVPQGLQDENNLTNVPADCEIQRERFS